MPYPINIEKNLAIKAEVLQGAQTTEDLLATRASTNETVRVLLASIQDAAMPETDKARFFQMIASKVLSFVWVTNDGSKTAYHETTVSLNAMPLSTLLEKFDPATDWGKNLHGYRGGELVVDFQDSLVRIMRERMVLPVPWYALGTPVQDMSKYEIAEYFQNSVKVSWKVVKSENCSVFEDFGYLLFKEVTVGMQKQTLMLFNSLHRFEVGWIARRLPKPLRDRMSMKAIKDAFTGYLEYYRKVIS